MSTDSWVDLYWLPLGAGDPVPCVRWNGRLFEALAARHDSRPRRALYHCALEVGLHGQRYAVELAPAWGDPAAGAGRGVVAEGPVGMRWLGRSRFFRYEVRRWRDGAIPDAGYAVGEPARVSGSAALACRVLDLVDSFPLATWGRDDQGTGDMWNSNSLVSWLLASSGTDTDSLAPPPGGRAPGWSAGLVVAGRVTR